MNSLSRVNPIFSWRIWGRYNDNFAPTLIVFFKKNRPSLIAFHNGNISINLSFFYSILSPCKLIQTAIACLNQILDKKFSGKFARTSG